MKPATTLEDEEQQQSDGKQIQGLPQAVSHCKDEFYPNWTYRPFYSFCWPFQMASVYASVPVAH